MLRSDAVAVDSSVDFAAVDSFVGLAAANHFVDLLFCMPAFSEKREYDEIGFCRIRRRRVQWMGRWIY